MILKCLGTGSSGNCYILNAENKLIIDAGINIKKIKAGLGWTLQGVAGAIISHSHKDHSLSEKALMDLGLLVWTPYRNGKPISRVRFDEFLLTSFPVPHAGTENRGFIININGWTMCYITDFEYVPYSLKKFKLNSMLIECNYTSIADDAENLEHVVRGHAGLPMVKRFVQHNASENLESVVLCHLSASNADSGVIEREIQSVVPPGCRVMIAEPGGEYEI